MAEVSIRILMIRELVEPKHQLFHHRVNSCSYKLDRQFLSNTLIENMIHYNGIGLSANQIGIWERAFVMVRDLEHNEVMVCFNPRIINHTLKKLKWKKDVYPIQIFS